MDEKRSVQWLKEQQGALVFEELLFQTVVQSGGAGDAMETQGTIGCCQYKIPTDPKTDGRKSLHVSGSAIQKYAYRVCSRQNLVEVHKVLLGNSELNPD